MDCSQEMNVETNPIDEFPKIEQTSSTVLRPDVVPVNLLANHSFNPEVDIIHTDRCQQMDFIPEKLKDVTTNGNSAFEDTKVYIQSK